MFKPTNPLFKAKRRLQLTTKRVPNGYYKGNRTGSMGEHTKWGGYRIDWRKVRTYVAPTGLETFKLTPFVTKKMDPLKTGPNDRMTAQKFLDLIRDENPQEMSELLDSAGLVNEDIHPSSEGEVSKDREIMQAKGTKT